MGTSYRFDCPSCGYSAQVSGNDDAGMIATTATIVCKACRRLYDAPTALAKEFGDSRDPVPLRCPRAKYHPIERWKAGDPCPRCGTSIPCGEATILWD